MNLYKVLQISPLFSGYGISVMNKVLSNGLLKGRPYGGVHTLIRNSPDINVICLSAVERYVILLLGKSIIVNVYFPCTSVADYSGILLSLLSKIWLNIARLFIL